MEFMPEIIETGANVSTILICAWLFRMDKAIHGILSHVGHLDKRVTTLEITNKLKGVNNGKA